MYRRYLDASDRQRESLVEPSEFRADSRSRAAVALAAEQSSVYVYVRAREKQHQADAAALPKLCSADESRPKNETIRRIARPIYLRMSGVWCFPYGSVMVQVGYLDHTAIVVAIVVPPFRTDHLFSPFGTTVKQLGFACCQVVQNPFALSFHVPLSLYPAWARGSRVILPSGVNVILN